MQMFVNIFIEQEFASKTQLVQSIHVLHAVQILMNVSIHENLHCSSIVKYKLGRSA